METARISGTSAHSPFLPPSPPRNMIVSSEPLEKLEIKYYHVLLLLACKCLSPKINLGSVFIIQCNTETIWKKVKI
jgi:hypothetical protein